MPLREAPVCARRITAARTADTRSGQEPSSPKFPPHQAAAEAIAVEAAAVHPAEAAAAGAAAPATAAAQEGSSEQLIIGK